MNPFFTIPLRKVTVSQKGIKPSILKDKPFEHSVPYLDISALETGEIKEYTYRELGNLSTANDVLVVWDGSRSGLAFRGQAGIIGSTIMKITPIGLDAEYLHLFLKCHYEYLNKNAIGGGIPHVNADLFFDLAIPYISLPVQKEIVKGIHQKLDDGTHLFNNQRKTIRQLLSAQKISTESVDNIPDALKSFRSTILEKAISGNLTENWRVKSNTGFPKTRSLLTTVILNIQSGKSFRCIERPPEKNEIGVVKISAVSSGGFIEQESKTCIDKSKINANLYIQSGDFLMSRANTKELVGACVIVDKITKKIMLSDKIWRVSFDNKLVADEYMVLFLRSKDGRSQIENFASGSQESMKNITQNDLKSITMPVPTLGEQKEIVKIAHSLLKIVEEIEHQYRLAKDTFSKLEKSILIDAFGEHALRKHQSDLTMEKINFEIDNNKMSLLSEYTAKNKMQSKARKAMKKTIAQKSTKDIEEVLAESDGPKSAREVWKESKYNGDIDGFYEALKAKIPGKLNWNIVKADESVPESLISLKNAL
jgi:restriction endonuclease S subunit